MGEAGRTNSRHCLALERFVMAAPGTPSGEPSNVGRMYALFAQAIRDGKSHQPTFETAVDLHRLIDAIRQSSEDGCEVTFGQTPH